MIYIWPIIRKCDQVEFPTFLLKSDLYVQIDSVRYDDSVMFSKPSMIYGGPDLVGNKKIELMTWIKS